MDYIKRTAHIFFTAFGFAAFGFLFANRYCPSIFSVKTLWQTMLVLAGMAVLSAFLFGGDAYRPKSLWLRRGISAGGTCVLAVLTAFLFRIITSLKVFIIYTAFIIAAVAVLSMIVYLISDCLEKRSLKDINDELNRINDDENEK